jgi:GTP pyrophosphokinase
MSRNLALGPPDAFGRFAHRVGTIVRRHGVRCRIRIQAKSLPSIHRKMVRADAAIDGIPDRYIIEVVVSNRDACYRTLGFLHARFAPVMESFKDFIALPKRNRYQALHTTVIEGGHRFEVHVQTPAMHRLGEFGVASLRGGHLQEESRRRWLEELADWHEQDASSQQSLNELKRILFTREIATFTPDGDPIVLPEGATVLDFAFAVHTDLGMHCQGAVINGRPSSPFTVLAWGDTIRVESSPDQRPRQSWLRHVRSFRARKLISRYLHRNDAASGLMFV